MKIASIICNIIGALGAFFLGMKWMSDLNSELGQAATAMGGSPELTNLKTAATLLIICAIIGIVATVLLIVKKIPKFVVGVLLILAGIFPIFFAGKAVFGLPMVLGGIFAFLIKEE